MLSIKEYSLISALVQTLPKDCQWTAVQRDKWMRAFTSAIALLIDIIDEEEIEAACLADTPAALEPKSKTKERI